MTPRELDPGMSKDLSEEMTYAEYLRLDVLLNCQSTLSSPPHHDELLFIIQHQTTELWFKPILHELRAALEYVSTDRIDAACKVLARVKHIQNQLFQQWSVLATLTPSEYTQFRNVLGSSSGFQSVQYRLVEFLLGNKDRKMLDYHAHDPEVVALLRQVLEAPSLYDATIRHLSRIGIAVPDDVLHRDVSEPHTSRPEVVQAFRAVYDDPDAYWDTYNLCEKLVDLEEHFSLWRFRHMKVVQRVIGFKRGTGGSTGVPFLRKMVDHVFFPELWEVRTEL